MPASTGVPASDPDDPEDPPELVVAPELDPDPELLPELAPPPELLDPDPDPDPIAASGLAEFAPAGPPDEEQAP
jgi:hypothetical protein